MAAGASSLAAAFADATSMRQMQDLYKTFFYQDGRSFGDKTAQFAAGYAAGAIPNVVGATARGLDSTLPEKSGPLDEFKVVIPGLSNKLPNKVDSLGQVQRRYGGLAGQLANPVRTSKPDLDAIDRELLSLSYAPPLLTKELQGLTLKGEELEAWRLYAGEARRMNLEALIGSPNWDSLSNRDKEEQLNKMFKGVDKGAKEVFIQSGQSALSRSLLEDPKNRERALAEILKEVPKLQSLTDAQMKVYIKKHFNELSRVHFPESIN
jgi:hypothetical protein